ncbi:MAG: GDSL-type esterase/lipase family protein [Acidobacteriota bacterium]|nr:GDSL-type esterase/lipase family protein [Acidobacteriota bacterium]
MKRIAFVTLILGFTQLADWGQQPVATPQTSALLSAADAQKLVQRTLQLMESTAVSVPGLTQSGAIISKNAGQSAVAMQANPQNAAFTYDFVRETRAYLALSDAVVKPFPFSNTARQQFSELRDAVDRLDTHFHALLDQKEVQLRNSDRDNLHRYAEADEKLGTPGSKPRVVFMGDSITDGWRLNEYFTGRDFVNRGISGQITGQMLGRMEADVIDLHPKAVLILAGINDIGRGIPVKAIENNLTMMIVMARAYSIKPLVASIMPVSDYHKDANPRYEMTKTHPPAAIVEINGWLRDYCEHHSSIYVDYYSAMVDRAGFLQADLSDDGLHPNAKGYRVMAPIALEALGRVLAPAPQQTEPEAKRHIKLF